MSKILDKVMDVQLANEVLCVSDACTFAVLVGKDPNLAKSAVNGMAQALTDEWAYLAKRFHLPLYRPCRAFLKPGLLIEISKSVKQPPEATE